ncbi:TetR/AcrR family transcriptional regulator [Subtercola sp. RTI3]|uniref:TetR/AcrR family transcriptional regulator n=1 Tax=Subtercola sp. RTI3 TaxID=3048639 RepID=UPI002B2250D5|nr:TetR/AcrR family transcriptional regulator [Subtercola sp. RTI3]MEA9985085.1 TetR/AcrR family transcriptional regulator [Subtercola sp. RTI3]
MVEKRVNPRVDRTKTRVLEVAHEMLDELGPAGLTYTSLASRSGVTRQTLYRHWPERDALLADVILTGPDVGYPVAGPDARIIIIDFLASLRDGLSHRPTASALLAIAAQAADDSGSADALNRVIVDRTSALNSLLLDTGVELSPDDYAQVTGPVIVQVLIARGPVSDQLIQRTVDAWMTQQADLNEQSQCRAE